MLKKKHKLGLNPKSDPKEYPTSVKLSILLTNSLGFFFGNLFIDFHYERLTMCFLWDESSFPPGSGKNPKKSSLKSCIENVGLLKISITISRILDLMYVCPKIRTRSMFLRKWGSPEIHWSRTPCREKLNPMNYSILAGYTPLRGTPKDENYSRCRLKSRVYHWLKSPYIFNRSNCSIPRLFWASFVGCIQPVQQNLQCFIHFCNMYIIIYIYIWYNS